MKSSRVKAVDIDDSETLILRTLHSGEVEVWEIKCGEQKSNSPCNPPEADLKWKVSHDSPVRCGKFLSCQGLVVVGDDEGSISLYDMKGQLVSAQLKPHQDFVRCLDCDPSSGLILSGSDDTTIKLWKVSDGKQNKELILVRTFTGHLRYVMSVSFDPIDPNFFSSGSLDGTIMTWNVENGEIVAKWNAHTKSVNSVGHMRVGSSAILLSASDDTTVKTWNPMTGEEVRDVSQPRNLQSDNDRSAIENKNREASKHTANVSVVKGIPHGEWVSGGEDELIVWNGGVKNYGLGRVWALALSARWFCAGFDEGMIVTYRT